jgi:ABC-type phosphate/phosphonate transport system substrate-binding protein
MKHFGPLRALSSCARRLGRAWARGLLLLALATSVQPLQSVHAASLKLVVHEDTGNEGDPLPPASRFAALKKALETALTRPVELVFTRDRVRVLDMMERNQADIFITHASDLAAKALTGLGYSFVAAARPEANVTFIGKGAALENLTALKGKVIAMPRPELTFGMACGAELRDFVGSDYTSHVVREYSALVWAIENNVETVGCIPSIARAAEGLQKKGIKVLYQGRPIPTFPIVASPSVPAADRATIAKLMSNLDEDNAALKSLGVIGYTEGGELRLRALNGWLKPK